MNLIKGVPTKSKIFIIAIVVLLIAAISVTAVAKGNWYKKVDLEYKNTVEKQLAEAVKEYLLSYISDMQDNNSNSIANAAIQNYNTILESGVEQITDEHTAALRMSISNIIHSNINESEGLIESDFELLANGVCQIIYDTLLEQIEASDVGNQEEFSEEYTVLMDSLQSQIDSIKENGQAVSITANIKNNSAEITEDYQNALSKQKQSIVKDLSDEIKDAKAELAKTVSSEVEAKTKNIKSGKDGKDGKSIVGKDGNDGKSIFFVYSAYENGMNGKEVSISKTPSDEMKYMGTCTASKDPGITDATKYTWTQYKDDGKSIFFVYSAFENGMNGEEVSISKTPSDEMKYMGTCAAVEDPGINDATKYVWTQYKGKEMVLTPIIAEEGKSSGVRITMK